MSRSLSVVAAAALTLAACRPTKPLQQAPDIGFPTLLQAPKTELRALSELRGQVVVLEFWATWCKPCLEKLPHMNGLVEAFQGMPVRFISVTDEPASTVAAYTAKHPMKAWIALDPDKTAARAFRVRGIPDVFIIDPFGRIHLRISPSFLYKSDIAKALNAKAPEPAPPQTAPSP